jgi:hypothetical protein
VQLPNCMQAPVDVIADDYLYNAHMCLLYIHVTQQYEACSSHAHNVAAVAAAVLTTGCTDVTAESA